MYTTEKLARLRARKQNIVDSQRAITARVQAEGRTALTMDET
ncbi:hypothetical protein [Mycolicibacterium thermoresistibile]